MLRQETWSFSKPGLLWHLESMKIRKSHERGHANHGWLETHHSFSFGDYYDVRWMGFRSLRVINDDLIMPGQGFGMHPHRNMEIITYILSGSLEHKDSLGNCRVIRTGDVQYMSAGTGVRHSEWNPSPDEPVHLLQIWIEPESPGLEPRYADKNLAHSPTGAFRLIASREGREDSIAIRQDADLWMARWESGERATHHLGEGRHAWVHIALGEVALNGETLGRGDAVAIDHPTALELRALKPSQVLLFDLN